METGDRAPVDGCHCYSVDGFNFCYALLFHTPTSLLQQHPNRIPSLSNTCRNDRRCIDAVDNRVELEGKSHLPNDWHWP
ncbi:hypothetical protein EMPG_17046 [Blastomyces silverae]|uniref:Uncharacterized protein n=1 Tax=Blastomyces silverae TaxID=2060906 RepID=A0A0H1B8Z4_9EURO|nr:hypothetical protein EMPG_17046 [Blastomyces silverae]